MQNGMTDTFQALRVKPERGYCQGCTLPVSEHAYRVPKLPGIFCSIACIETELFRFERCRWCAEPIDRTYTGIESRLCSDDCRENYFAHVMGDYSAELGTGKRLLLWLQHKQPSLYRQIIGGITTLEGYCRNSTCPNGEHGHSASLSHLRAGSLYCCESCKKQALRSPKRDFSQTDNRINIEVSRDTSPELIARGKENAFALETPLVRQ